MGLRESLICFTLICSWTKHLMICCPLSCPLSYPIMSLLLLPSYVSFLLSSFLPSALSPVLSWLSFPVPYSNVSVPVLASLSIHTLSALLFCPFFSLVLFFPALSLFPSTLSSCSTCPVLSRPFFCPVIFSLLSFSCHLSCFLSSPLACPLFYPLAALLPSFLSSILSCVLYFLLPSSFLSPLGPIEGGVAFQTVSPWGVTCREGGMIFASPCEGAWPVSTWRMNEPWLSVCRSQRRGRGFYLYEERRRVVPWEWGMGSPSSVPVKEKKFGLSFSPSEGGVASRSPQC